MHQDKITTTTTIIIITIIIIIIIKKEFLPKSKMAIEKQVVYLSKQLMVVYILIGEFRILHPFLTDQYQFAFKHCL